MLSLSRLSVVFSVLLSAHVTQAKETQNVTTNWQIHCAMCHEYNGEATDLGIDVNSPTNIYNSSRNKTYDEIFSIVKDGKGRMPGYKDKLTDEEISNLVGHIEYTVLINKLMSKRKKIDRELESIKKTYKNLPECDKVRTDWPWK